MSEEKFSKFAIATIKRTAQSVNPIVVKKNKIKKEIESLNAQLTSLEAVQAPYEEAIKALTGGYTTEDLVEKVVTPKEDNKPSYTKYVLKYPTSVIPPTANATTTEDISFTETAATTDTVDTVNTTTDNTDASSSEAAEESTSEESKDATSEEKVENSYFS